MKHERVLLLAVLVLVLLIVGVLTVTFASKLGTGLSERIDPPTTTTFPVGGGS
jgi:hypothetical protein